MFVLIFFFLLNFKLSITHATSAPLTRVVPRPRIDHSTNVVKNELLKGISPNDMPTIIIPTTTDHLRLYSSAKAPVGISRTNVLTPNIANIMDI